MLRSLACLYVAGATLAEGDAQPRGPHTVKLPPYPWQRERYWLQGGSQGRTASAAPRGAGTHPLLGDRLDSATQPGTHHWQLDFDERTAHIGDHRIGGGAVAPGSVFVEIALAAFAEVRPDARPAIFGLRFREPLSFPHDASRRVQTVLVRDGEQASVRIFAQGSETVCLADARVAATPAGEAVKPLDVAALERRMTEQLSGAELYDVLASLGLDYGPGFRGVESIARRDGEALARLRLPAAVADGAGEYRLHPTLFDTALQVALAPALGPGWGVRSTRTFLTESIGRILVHRSHGESAWAHAVVRLGGVDDRVLEADVRMVGDDGEVLVEATGVRIMAFDRPPESSRPPARGATGAGGGDAAAATRDMLVAFDGATERRLAIEDVIRANIGKVVRLPAERIDRDRPLSAFGIDSIMSLELRNRLEAALGVQLSATLIWNYPTVREMAPFLLAKMGLEPTSGAGAPGAADRTDALEDEVGSDSEPRDESDVDALHRELAELSRELESI
jgi:acyl transferase domain-containing protein